MSSSKPEDNFLSLSREVIVGIFFFMFWVVIFLFLVLLFFDTMLGVAFKRYLMLGVHVSFYKV